ncbi:hypothetical protein D3C80_2196400 [compost metagenome]
MCLGGTVATKQLIVEKQADLVHRMISGQIEGIQQIGLAVGAQFCQRDLRPSDDHRLIQVLQHEG